MERTEGSETSAIINQTPGNYPKENLPHSSSCPLLAIGVVLGEPSTLRVSWSPCSRLEINAVVFACGTIPYVQIPQYRLLSLGWGPEIELWSDGSFCWYVSWVHSEQRGNAGTCPMPDSSTFIAFRESMLEGIGTVALPEAVGAR